MNLWCSGADGGAICRTPRKEINTYVLFSYGRMSVDKLPLFPCVFSLSCPLTQSTGLIWRCRAPSLSLSLPLSPSFSLVCIPFSLPRSSVDFLPRRLTLSLRRGPGWVMFISMIVFRRDLSPRTSHFCLSSFLFPLLLKPLFISDMVPGLSLLLCAIVSPPFLQPDTDTALCFLAFG